MGDARSSRWPVLVSAFSKSIRCMSNMLAPLVIVTYFREVRESFEFIANHGHLAAWGLLLFFCVFAYSLFQQLGVGRLLSTLGLRRQTAAIPPQRQKRRLFWTAVGLVSALSGLALVLAMYLTVYVSGLHYAVIASAPSKHSAIQEITRINQLLTARGSSSLRARAHESTKTGNPWYMISIGGFHTSSDSARDTLRQARRALGDELRQDAFIYSTSSASFTRQLKLGLVQAYMWLRNKVS